MCVNEKSMMKNTEQPRYVYVAGESITAQKCPMPGAVQNKTTHEATYQEITHSFLKLKFTITVCLLSLET